MIFWLDNKDNHRDAVNENYGRELLELFAMGVGSYTEDDVRQASRAFTGWTVSDAPYFTRRAERCSVWPYGDIEPQFRYDADDHDDGEKTFLGETGTFDGEEIVDIICKRPATARFIARHLYNFFVADEPQVPAWETVPPRDSRRDPGFDGRLCQQRLRDSGGPAVFVQLRLLQERDLRQSQKPGRAGGRDGANGRRLRVPQDG